MPNAKTSDEGQLNSPLSTDIFPVSRPGVSNHYITASDLLSWVGSAQNNLVGMARPGPTNDSSEGYSAGSVWIDTTSDQGYVCLSATEGAAVWGNTTSVARETGLISGGLLSAGANTGEYTLSAGVGAVVDYSDPERPAVTIVRWGEIADVTPANLGSEVLTEVAINAAGAIVEKNSEWSPGEIRDLIVIGRAVHSDSANLIAFIPRPVVAQNRFLSILDLVRALSPANLDGNVFGPNGSDLKMAKTAGSTFRLGANYDSDPTSPNVSADPELPALTFSYVYRDGSGGFTIGADTTDVTPGLRDTNTGTPTGVTSTRYTYQRIYYFSGSNRVLVLYGQQQYTNRNQALQRFDKDQLEVVVPDFVSDASLRGWMLVREGVTDLSSADVDFFPAPLLGVKAGGIGNAGGNVNAASVDYDNATSGLSDTDAQGAIDTLAAGLAASAPLFPASAAKTSAHTLVDADATKRTNLDGTSAAVAITVTQSLTAGFSVFGRVENSDNAVTIESSGTQALYLRSSGGTVSSGTGGTTSAVIALAEGDEYVIDVEGAERTNVYVFEASA